jgi:hypothetical protein
LPKNGIFLLFSEHAKEKQLSYVFFLIMNWQERVKKHLLVEVVSGLLLSYLEVPEIVKNIPLPGKTRQDDRLTIIIIWLWMRIGTRHPAKRACACF